MREFLMGRTLAGFALLPALCASPPPKETTVAMIEEQGEARRWWPRWRGPSGQGLVDGGGYPYRWSDQENLLWKVPLPGAGNSSPIVWRDRILLTTAYEGGARRSILCLRRADGKPLWETFVPAAAPERANRKNGHASSTPSTDGERVYAYLGSHGVLCLDMDGRQVWHQSFGGIDAYHGTACSPLLYKDRVILYQDQQGTPSRSFITALDKRTGKLLWTTPREARVGWGSPIAIRAGDRDEIVASGMLRVHAYDPASGAPLWSVDGNLFEVIPTPAAGLGLLFCSSGRAGPTLAIRPGGSGDVSRTHIAWQSSKGSPFVPSPLLYGDYLYMVNDMMSIATCYEARTGRLMWQERLTEPRRESFSASPVGVDGKVFFTNDDGDTFVLAAGPVFRLLHVNRFAERTLASPALVEGRWYFRTDRHLWAIGGK